MNATGVDATDWTEEKNFLPKTVLCQQTKTAADDNDNNVAMCIKKNTTINLYTVCVDQITSNDCITKASCDDMFVRKKCLITCVVNNVNKHAAGNHWKMAF